MPKCGCGVEQSEHWLCRVCKRPFHKYRWLKNEFPILGITTLQSPSLQICGFCHRARKRYEELLQYQPQISRPYLYVTPFPRYPYQNVTNTMQIIFYNRSAEPIYYGSPISEYDAENCIICNQLYDSYITPKPIAQIYLQLGQSASDKILRSFQICRDCREEYAVVAKRAADHPDMYNYPSSPDNDLLLQPDPDAWLRTADLLTENDDGRGRRLLIAFKNAEQRQNPNYYMGPKCAHSVTQKYCYFCRFKGASASDEGLNPDDLTDVPINTPINPFLLKIFTEHSFGNRLNRILNFLEQNDTKISKAFLQQVSDYYHKGIDILKRWQKLPDIFVGIFQRYHLTKFDHTLIRFLIKFIKPGQYHTEESIRNAITYFVEGRYDIKAIQESALAKWNEHRYRARLHRLVNDYPRVYNSLTLRLDIKAPPPQANSKINFQLSSVISRPWPGLSLSYNRAAKMVIISTVSKTNLHGVEEVPYLTQALLLYHLVDIIGDIEILKIEQNDMLNPTTGLMRKRDEKTHKTLIEQRAYMQSGYAETLAMGTPNLRNSLDLARYLQDLSRGEEIPLPPFQVRYEHHSVYDGHEFDHTAFDGILVFEDPIVIHRTSARKPLGYQSPSSSSSSASSNRKP